MSRSCDHTDKSQEEAQLSVAGDRVGDMFSVAFLPSVQIQELVVPRKLHILDF